MLSPMNTESGFRKSVVVFFAIACLLTMGSESMSGAAGESPSAVYKGLWKGQYKGRVFVILRLSPDDQGSFEGTIAVGTVQVGGNGEVNEVTNEAEVPVPISDVQTKEGLLTFKAKNDDDLMSYRMKIAGADEAELRINGAPPNMKPFTLKREPAQH